MLYYKMLMWSVHFFLHSFRSILNPGPVMQCGVITQRARVTFYYAQIHEGKVEVDHCHM